MTRNFSLLIIFIFCSINITTSQVVKSGIKDDFLSQYCSISEAKVFIQGSIYTDFTKSPEDRARDLLSHMTFDEKVMLTGGWSGIKIRGSFNIPGIYRLGIRPVTMSDASQGIRKIPLPSMEDSSGTSFPSLLALTSSWDTELAYRYGKAVGEECRALGIDILLGPGMNFYRLPTGGRHFEYLGEDPFLAKYIATEYIIGLQSQKIVATPKVVLANEQEFVRHIANCLLTDRAMREIYLVPWKSAIEKGDAKAIMMGNNMVNDIPCAIHQPLIEDIFRKEYGFKGIAMTDWQNTNYFPSLQHLIIDSGISLLMPSNKNFINYIDELKRSGQFDKENFEERLDEMVYHNLLPLFEMSIYDRSPFDEAYLKTFNIHQELARECAEESMVLLKNEGGILPLERGSRNILMTGVEEDYSGKGSGFVKGYAHTSFCQGLLDFYREGIKYRSTASEEDVRQAEKVIFILNKESGEGRDIPWEEPKEQLEYLRQILDWNSNTIVIVNSTNSMPLDWIKKAKAILWGFFQGQERGNALVNIISGKVNPSGKLTFSIERDYQDSVDPDYNLLCGTAYWRGDNSYKDYWLNYKDVDIPGFSDCVKPRNPISIPYNEDIFIGYRWYDSQNIPVLFPFGYGLSYTTFKYTDLQIENQLSSDGTLNVSVKVKNAGKVKGKEVVQLYISDLDGRSDNRPEKELKGFSKVELKPGESRTVVIILSEDDFAFWDQISGKWKIKPGKYEIKVGGSSQNLLEKKVISL
jgi:beta-glucosidase